LKLAEVQFNTELPKADTLLIHPLFELS